MGNHDKARRWLEKMGYTRSETKSIDYVYYHPTLRYGFVFWLVWAMQGSGECISPVYFTSPRGSYTHMYNTGDCSLYTFAELVSDHFYFEEDPVGRTARVIKLETDECVINVTPW
jgi:hypothetical protein